MSSSFFSTTGAYAKPEKVQDHYQNQRNNEIAGEQTKSRKKQERDRPLLSLAFSAAACSGVMMTTPGAATTGVCREKQASGFKKEKERKKEEKKDRENIYVYKYTTIGTRPFGASGK